MTGLDSTTAAILGLIATLVSAVISITALIVLFKLPGYLDRQEKRTEAIAKAAAALPGLIGHNCREIAEHETQLVRAACKSLVKALRTEANTDASASKDFA